MRCCLRCLRADSPPSPAAVDPDPVVLVMMRVRSSVSISPTARRLLRQLRLDQVGCVVFFRARMLMPRLRAHIRLFVHWRKPSLTEVQSLLRCSFTKVDGRRVLVHDYAIRRRLGKFGILNMSDLMRELSAVGPHFEQACRFLCPCVITRSACDSKSSETSCDSSSDSDLRWQEARAHAQSSAPSDRLMQLLGGSFTLAPQVEDLVQVCANMPELQLFPETLDAGDVLCKLCCKLRHGHVLLIAAKPVMVSPFLAAVPTVECTDTEPGEFHLRLHLVTKKQGRDGLITGGQLLNGHTFVWARSEWDEVQMWKAPSELRSALSIDTALQAGATPFCKADHASESPPV